MLRTVAAQEGYNAPGNSWLICCVHVDKNRRDFSCIYTFVCYHISRSWTWRVLICFTVFQYKGKWYVYHVPSENIRPSAARNHTNRNCSAAESCVLMFVNLSCSHIESNLIPTTLTKHSNNYFNNFVVLFMVIHFKVVLQGYSFIVWWQQ